LITITSINAAFALLIGLGISNLFRPGTFLTGWSHGADGRLVATAWTPPAWNLQSWIQGLAPRSVLDAAIENSVISLAIGAVALGAATRALMGSQGLSETQARLAVDLAELGQRTFEKSLLWMVQLAPLAVMAVVAAAVGAKGLASLGGLWAYLAAGAAGLALHVTVVYMAWIRWARVPLRTFWRTARKPVSYSLGTNSSLATLPLTLEALGELKVSEKASALGACIGTNLNNDGILLYEAMAVLFVAQAHGIELGPGTQLQIVGLCWLATVGIGGVPEAGFVSLSIILTQTQLPLELLPFLLSVDWVLARLRSMTNVLSDMTTSIVIDRWMTRAGGTGSSAGPAPSPPAT
jgi:DAACS family dicarboxylate/amino acid:cation (Na+ or H+) symporter